MRNKRRMTINSFSFLVVLVLCSITNTVCLRPNQRFSQISQNSKGNIYHQKYLFVTDINYYSARYSNEFYCEEASTEFNTNWTSDFDSKVIEDEIIVGGYKNVSNTIEFSDLNYHNGLDGLFKLTEKAQERPLKIALKAIQTDLQLLSTPKEADKSVGDISYQEKFKLTLNSIQKDIDKWKKPDLPPFKINDLSLLLFEVGFIFLSQLFIGIYTVINSTGDFHFTRFLESKSLETFYSATVFHTFFASLGLSLFWVFSKWWSRNLDRNVFFYRLKDVFDATWQQWIAVANLYIASCLLYSFVNHVEVTGIESPLLSGAVAILLARILYYGIPI
jgi:hypothetical protein